MTPRIGGRSQNAERSFIIFRYLAANPVFALPNSRIGGTLAVAVRDGIADLFASAHGLLQGSLVDGKPSRKQQRKEK